MQVVACFRCTSKLERDSNATDRAANPNPVDVTFVPTFDDNGPNKSWSKYTPSGEIKLCITNPSAANGFEVGADYMITFEKATPEQVHPPKN